MFKWMNIELTAFFFKLTVVCRDKHGQTCSTDIMPGYKPNLKDCFSHQKVQYFLHSHTCTLFISISSVIYAASILLSNLNIKYYFALIPSFFLTDLVLLTCVSIRDKCGETCARDTHGKRLPDWLAPSGRYRQGRISWVSLGYMCQLLS